MALLLYSEQQNLKPISPNWANSVKIQGGKTNFVQLEEEIENGWLKTLLGAAFLYWVQQNPTVLEVISLLGGAVFKDCDNNDIEFRGLKYQIAFMVYAKYIDVSDQADTFTGLVRQNREEANPLSEGAIKRGKRDAESLVMQDFEIMKVFISQNAALYPLWSNGKTRDIFVPKLTTIRKTYN